MSPAAGRDPLVRDLLRDLEVLRAENDRLRGLLGLGDRPVDGHARAWAPTLLAEPPEWLAVDGASTPAEKLALFRSLFGARSDVYAYRWESASSGKTGWSPATKSRWSKGRPPRDYMPLTDDVFVTHLRGEETVGIYPLLRGDTCALLACDFDQGTWASTRSRTSTPVTTTVCPQPGRSLGHPPSSLQATFGARTPTITGLTSTFARSDGRNR